MQVRTYGKSGPLVIVLHGGPGAPGHMAPVARGLADTFKVLEPFQRPSGDEPLTVAAHVEDLRHLIALRSAGARPALVGSSWGAMLALAFAAAHPDLAGPLVLIGCGTFDVAARTRFHRIMADRTGEALKRRLGRLEQEFPDPDQRLKARAELLLPLYSHDLFTTDMELTHCDARAHEETWSDMVRLQEQGVYPVALFAIRSPVLMLHGAVDPHPGQMIMQGLRVHIPQIEYREWQLCGHYPWLEKAVTDEFFAVLRAWLAAHVPP